MPYIRKKKYFGQMWVYFQRWLSDCLIVYGFYLVPWQVIVIYSQCWSPYKEQYSSYNPHIPWPKHEPNNIGNIMASEHCLWVFHFITLVSDELILQIVSCLNVWIMCWLILVPDLQKPVRCAKEVASLNLNLIFVMYPQF